MSVTVKPDSRPYRHWRTLLEPAWKKPGEWIEVETYDDANAAYSAARYIRDGRAAAPGDNDRWDAITRKLGDRHYTVYARYDRAR